MNQASSSSSVQAETLDATITYLEGLPTGVDTESAVSSVSAWMGTLKADGRPELQAVESELKTLMGLLTSSKLDGAAIGNVMIRLGDLTRQTTALAEGPIAGRLTKLAEWLTKAGKAMQPVS